MTTLRSLILSIDARAAKAGAAQYATAAAQVQTANAGIRGAVLGVDRSVAASSRSFRGAIAPMRSFLVTAGLFAGVGATVRTLTEFEDAIARVSATTSASGSDLRAYSKLARDIGATTEFTAGQVANAEVQLAQAGLTLRESIAALPAVTDFATASALSLGQAADITTKILAAYRLEASDASRVTDVIVTAANNATTSQAELARALVVSIPAAKGLGVEFEELVAVQAELARVGLRAEKGGRALDAVIRALTRPTERAERVFEQFGLTLEQVSVRRNGLIGVIGNLKAAGLGVEEFAKVFDSFGARAIPGLAAAVADIDLLRTKIEGADGATKRFANQVRDTLTGSFREMSSAFQEMILKAGESGLGGALRGLAERMRDAFRSEGAQLLARSVGDLFTAVNSTIDLVADLSRFLSGVSGNAGNAAREADRLGDSASTLGPVFESLSSPLKTFSALALSVRKGFLEIQRAVKEIQLLASGTLVQAAFKFSTGIDLSGLETDKTTLLRELDRIEKDITQTVKNLANLDTAFADSLLAIAGEHAPGIREVEAMRERFRRILEERKKLQKEAQEERDRERRRRQSETEVLDLPDVLERDQRSPLESLRQNVAREAELAEAASRGFEAYRSQSHAIEARNILLESGIRITEQEEKVTAALVRRFYELQEGNQRYLQILEETRRAGEEVGAALGTFIGDLASDFDSAADAARRFAQSLQEIALNQIVVRPLSELFGNIFSSVQGTAGGIVQSLFGGSGIPASAALPQGVSASSKSTVINQTINIGDRRNDSRGFRLSGRQIAESAGQIYSRAV